MLWIIRWPHNQNISLYLYWASFIYLKYSRAVLIRRLGNDNWHKDFGNQSGKGGKPCLNFIFIAWLSNVKVKPFSFGEQVEGRLRLTVAEQRVVEIEIGSRGKRGVLAAWAIAPLIGSGVRENLTGRTTQRASASCGSLLPLPRKYPTPWRPRNTITHLGHLT